MKQTIAQVLSKAPLNAILSDGTRTWKVTDLDFDGAVVASPFKWKKTWGSSFELWSLGIESVAYIPNLKVIKK
jgi:hypothetical protein